MSFAGALGQGLLGAVAGGAGAYVDETKRQVARDDAAAEREKLMRLQDEISAARQRAVEEEKRKRAETDRSEAATRRRGYADKAGGLLSTPEDFEFKMNNMDEGTPTADSVAAAGPVKTSAVDNYSRYSKAAELAAMDGREEDARVLASLAGKSPAEIRKAMIDQGKTIAEIKKIESDVASAGNYELSEGQARYDKNNNLVASRGKTFAPDRSGGDGSGKDKAEEAKTVKSYFTRTVQRLAGEGKGIKDVTEFDEAGYQTFARWLAATGREGNLSSYNAWVADGKRSSPGGNKQPLAKTSGNMPAKSLSDIWR